MLLPKQLRCIYLLRFKHHFFEYGHLLGGLILKECTKRLKVKLGLTFKNKIYLTERPREEKTLPTVLSEKEITVFFKHTENLKYPVILITTYPTGLRVSETVNLKIKEIDSERMQIRIEQSKRKTNRYSLLAKRTLIELQKYVTKYHPKIWLFEGQFGEQYSARNV